MTLSLPPPISCSAAIAVVHPHEVLTSVIITLREALFLMLKCAVIGCLKRTCPQSYTGVFVVSFWADADNGENNSVISMNI